MSSINFSKNKKDVLSKVDKSFKGRWDEKIVKLCDKINSLPDYFTTSSCSGRVVLIKASEKKQKGLILKSYHSLVNFKTLKKDLEELGKRGKCLIYFKQEPCILHVACVSLEKAQELLDKGKFAGWKKSGIIASKRKFVVELTSTEKLEFPIINKGKILIDNDFLKFAIKEANKKLKRSWKKIKKLKKIVK